jgi:DNA-binding response OmpR family regulator
MVTEKGTNVLVVEDDPMVADVVVRYLTHEGFSALSVGDGAIALDHVEKELPDLVILDIMLPGIDGLEVCRRLRSTYPIPIIMLTALGDESDRVIGLEIGADDYITKPFSPRELVARVRSVLRRADAPVRPSRAGELAAGALAVDPGAHEARLAGELLSLTAREFDLLVFLMEHPRQVFSREDLLEKVWGYVYGDRSTVTVHVRRLREKVETNPSDPRFIVTVWGVGYRFDP